MLTGSIRNEIGAVWYAFWSGGVSNPLSVIEQITYLLFIKGLDDIHPAMATSGHTETLVTSLQSRAFRGEL